MNSKRRLILIIVIAVICTMGIIMLVMSNNTTYYNEKSTLNTIYGSLDSGTYRVLKNISKDNQTYDVFLEFTI